MGRASRAGHPVTAVVSVITASVVALGTGALLSGCVSAGTADARAACGHVATSLALFRQSGHDGAHAAAERASALDQLRLALPEAALASTKDTTWDALVTTLSETSRVPEANLVHALTQQCAVFGGAAPTS